MYISIISHEAVQCFGPGQASPDLEQEASGVIKVALAPGSPEICFLPIGRGLEWCRAKVIPFYLLGSLKHCEGGQVSQEHSGCPVL